MVGLAGHSDDRCQFVVLRVAHALRPGSSGVRMDAVGASVGDRNCNVDHLFRKGIDLAWPHDGFQIIPYRFQPFRVMGQCPPEIVYEVGFSGFSYVVKNGGNFR